MTEKFLNSPDSDTQEAAGSNKHSDASLSVVEDILKPGANVFLGTYGLARRGVEALALGHEVLPTIDLYAVRQATPGSAAQMAQTATDFAVGTALLAVGGKIAGKFLKGGSAETSLAARFEPTGRPSNIYATNRRQIEPTGDLVFHPPPLSSWQSAGRSDKIGILEDLARLPARGPQRASIVEQALFNEENDLHLRMLGAANIKHLPAPNQLMTWEMAWMGSRDPVEMRHLMQVLPTLDKSALKSGLAYVQLPNMSGHLAIDFVNAGHKPLPVDLPGELSTKITANADMTMYDAVRSASRELPSAQQAKILDAVASHQPPAAIGTNPALPGKPVNESFRIHSTEPAVNGDYVYPAMSYHIPGMDSRVVIGHDLAGHFPQLARLRSEALSGIDPAKYNLHPLRNAMLPEDYAAELKKLPDPRVVGRVIVPVGSGVERLTQWAGDQAGGTVFARANDMFLHSIFRGQETRQVIRHEWAHLFRFSAPNNVNRVYNAAAYAERNGYLFHNYGSFYNDKGAENLEENFAVHVGEALLGPRKTFEHAAHQAPLRSAVAGRMLEARLNGLPADMRSSMHEEWLDRVNWLKKNILPEARRLVSAESKPGDFKSRQSYSEIKQYLNSMSPSDVLKRRAALAAMQAG